MIQKVFKCKCRSFLLFAVILVSTFVLTACGSGGGSDEYDAPEGVSTPLVEGQTSSRRYDCCGKS